MVALLFRALLRVLDAWGFFPAVFTFDFCSPLALWSFSFDPVVRSRLACSRGLTLWWDTLFLFIFCCFFLFRITSELTPTAPPRRSGSLVRFQLALLGQHPLHLLKGLCGLSSFFFVDFLWAVCGPSPELQSNRGLSIVDFPSY